MRAESFGAEGLADKKCHEYFGHRGCEGTLWETPLVEVGCDTCDLEDIIYPSGYGGDGKRAEEFGADEYGNKSYDAESVVDIGQDWHKENRIMKLLRIVARKATGSNARYAKTYAREAENAYYQYGMRGLTTQVAYVLSNLSGWRGEEAKSVKAELRKLIK